MNYQELTPAQQYGYDGYMEPEIPERSGPPPLADETGLAAPAMDNIVSLKKNQREGSEDASMPVGGTGPEAGLMKNADRERRTALTRDKLMEISQTVQGIPNGGVIRRYAEIVAAAANVLEEAVMKKTGQQDVSSDLREKLEKANVFKRAQQLMQNIDARTEFASDPTGSRSDNARRHAGEVANLAKEVAGYFEAAKLTLERDEPFKPITSFEELMGKFNKIQLDARFRSGGEFSLIDVSEYQDEFGRTMLQEKAHPENFLRWVRERAWFYHDFDPMQNIDLFKGMYIVAGSRTVSMYEMLVDFDTYFAHRQETLGDLHVSTLELAEARAVKQNKAQTFFPIKDSVKDLQPGELYGHYKFIDQATGKEVTYNVILRAKNEEGYAEFNVVDAEGNPVQALKQNKEEWNNADSQQDISKEFEEVKTEIMYEIWLLTRSHNMDVAYRQKGMPSEAPLKETLAELYADNIMTRNKGRLLKMFNMPATTHREDMIFKGLDKEGNPIWETASNEAVEKMKGHGELGYQGSVGKAFQRSLALYYHISEASAAFKGYMLEDGRNPFFELFQKGDVSGAEIFYKSLIRRTLEDSKFNKDGLGYTYDEKHPEKSHVAAEFVALLNQSRISRPDGTTRKRFDWEKADLVDFLTLDTKQFLGSMRVKGIMQQHIDAVVAQLQELYATKNPERLQELQTLLQSDSATKKTNFLNSLHGGSSHIGEHEKFVDAFRKSNSLESLSAFAVALFVQSYPKDFMQTINPFENIRYPLEARDRMRNAMRDALIHTEKLDEFEAKYAEEWAYTMTFYTGISARNDMVGIGHDAWSKIINTEFYRLKQTGGGNYPGNLENLYGIHRLGTDMWQGLKVQLDGHNEYDTTLYEILTGLDGKTRTFNINKNMESYEFAGNAMRQFYADHVSHAIDLFIDITTKHEVGLDKLVKEDTLGRITINNAEMQKLIDSTWKHLRYAFDNNGMRYDNTMYGWWYDEAINEKGQVSRNQHFGFATLRNLMFSKEVQMMDMYNRTDVSAWENTPDNRMGKMARNVFAYLIKAQLEEHTKRSGTATLYTADQISLIADALMGYAARVVRGERGEAIVLSGFFSPEEMTRILFYAHAVLWKLYAKEYSKETFGGIIAGLFQMLSIIMKEAGAGITLK